MATTHSQEQQNTLNITEVSLKVGTSNNAEVNNYDLLDPSIMADREASLQVTAWVRANYVQEREHNVPRRNMFEHYKTYCTSSNLTPVNSATFGKLLRIVFPELKTRRLGVRGQSKYHYCGIRVRTADDDAVPVLPSYSENAMNLSNNRRYNSSSSGSSGPIPPPSPSNTIQSGVRGFSVPIITSVRLNSETDNNLIVSFTRLYEDHCKEIFSLLTSNLPEQVQEVMMTFYNDMAEEYIHAIQNIPELTEAVWRWDCVLYDSIIQHFVPHVNYQLTQDMVKTLRTYTRELSDYIESCMMNLPTTFHQKKADVARIFSAKSRRQLSLCSAAQSASTILNMTEHLAVMRHDWENFNFEGILDQSLWVCECDTAQIRKILYQDVFELLTSKIGLVHWMNWIKDLADKHLKNYAPNNMNDAPHYLARSKQLLLKWNFYTGLIIKDLALHQCGSFGSFHSLKVFLDDYLLFTVEENIAQVNYALMQQHQNVTTSYSTPTIVTSPN
ncbi:unnamed protein product [Mucor hiemalis]